MKFYNWFIKYRFYLGVLLLIIAIVVNILTSFWPSFILYFAAVLMIGSHFFIGPLRLIQTYLENGDFEGAEKVLNSIWFPNLLYKPVRSVYYTLKGNIAMTKQDFDSAEKHMKKSLDLGLPHERSRRCQ
jgi:hypothetical protein